MEGKAGKVKVTAGFCAKNGYVRESEWHEWELEWVHEVGEGRNDRLPKEDMRGTGVGQDGARGNGT